ncbi:hypothetical protein AAH991_14750 [Microbispora sp. ZYX-F-249]|uniref:MFS transporter n=1 Tax=Microbispora maris TaxID=3144104 RepID=A0ABV0AR08_9ACTN
MALPSIRIALDAPPSDLQWVVSGYAFAFGLLLVPAGRFGDTHGRRDVFLFPCFAEARMPSEPCSRCSTSADSPRSFSSSPSTCRRACTIPRCERAG